MKCTYYTTATQADVRRCALCSHTSLGLRAVALTCTCACTCTCCAGHGHGPLCSPAKTRICPLHPASNHTTSTLCSLCLTRVAALDPLHRPHHVTPPAWRCSTGPSWTHDMTICTCTVCSISLMYISTGTSCTCCCSLKLSALTTRRAMLRQLYLPAPSCGRERDWKNRSASLDGPFDEYRS